MASSCSSVRRWMGFSTVSELNFHCSFWCVDAGADDLALLPRDLAVAQVADLALLQLAHTRVADALAAAEGEVEPGLLTGVEDRSGAVALRFAIALQELDRAALALLDVADL